ncbi:MAG: hypothetical protein ACLFRR_00145 [Spirochaetaceae bacterium]
MSERSVWLETALLAVLAAFLYQSALLVFVFLVPLAVLAKRHGSEMLGYGCVFAAGIIVVSRGLGLARAEAEWDLAILLLELAPPAAFLAGMYLLETRRIVGMRRLYRLIQAVMIAGALSVPVIMVTSSSSIAMDVLRGQLELLHRAFGGEGEGGSFGRFATVDALMRAVFDMLLSTYLFAYSAVLAANWYLGQLIGARSGGSRAFRLRDYRVPEVFIWVLVAAALAALLGLAGNLGVFEHLSWNALFIVLFLYGGQGLGILWSLLDQYTVPQGFRIGIGAILAVLLVVPGANFLVLFGLPGLGVAETWVHFRSGERSS